MTATAIDVIFDLFARHGAVHYGEDASQLQHALQCAELARREDCAETLVAAALLHDIGQFMDGAGEAAELHGIDARHEIGGAAWLRRYFPDSVSEPVRLHVAAKRYLCAIEPGYEADLSAASVLSLRLQGGAMSAAERQAFEAEPFHADAVTLRRFDDAGKQIDWHPPTLESYRPLLTALLIPAA